MYICKVSNDMKRVVIDHSNLKFMISRTNLCRIGHGRGRGRGIAVRQSFYDDALLTLELI